MPEPRQPDSLRARIMSWSVYQSGEPFTRAEAAKRLKASPDEVSAALTRMRETGQVCVGSGGTWHRPQRHWIHNMRLAQPVHR